MKISIIIPFYRGLHYLEDCLDSLSAQGIKDLDTIIIEDGCDEEIGELCAGHNELNIRRVSVYEECEGKAEKAGQPAGVAAARNVGLKYASGDYVFFIDSDDYLEDNCLRQLKEHAVKSPDRVISCRTVKTWYKRSSYKAQKEETAGTAEPAMGTDSVTGVLIPAGFLVKTGEKFEESFKYYSDLSFICRMMSEGGFEICNEAVYIKRSHNDAVRLPSLSQIKDDNRPEEFAAAYKRAYACSAGQVRRYLEDYLCKYFLAKLTKGKKPEGLGWSRERLAAGAELLRDVSDDIMESCGRRECRLLKLLQRGKTGRALRLARLIVFLKKKKGLIGSRMQWKWAVYKRIFRRMPLKRNLVLFESFLGKSYGDSCRYIYEYMIKNYPDFDYVWIIDNKQARIPGKHKEAKPLSLRYFYYVARAAYWINNMRQPAWYEKREGCFFLETWHGTPLKRLVFDMEDVHSASPEYKMTFYKQSRIWDYLISDNRFSTDVFESAFLFPRERILELGYPRNDILYAPDAAVRAAEIKRRLGIPEGKKVVLYAPTWRDDDYYGPGQYKFELPLDLKLMKQLKKEYVFVLRTHYFIADNLNISEADKEFVIDASRYNDIGELYLISDILITDYSSVFFDFANLRRPILFYVYDFEKYRSVLRGFYIDMEKELPGPLLYTSAEVLKALCDIHKVEAEYAEKYREFCERFCSLDDGHAAERIVKRIFENGTEKDT